LFAWATPLFPTWPQLTSQEIRLYEYVSDIADVFKVSSLKELKDVRESDLMVIMGMRKGTIDLLHEVLDKVLPEPMPDHTSLYLQVRDLKEANALLTKKLEALVDHFGAPARIIVRNIGV